MEALDRLEKHWRWWVILFWLAAALMMLWQSGSGHSAQFVAETVATA